MISDLGGCCNSGRHLLRYLKEDVKEFYEKIIEISDRKTFKKKSLKSSGTCLFYEDNLNVFFMQ